MTATFDLFIGGKDVRASSEQRISRAHPVTHEPVASYACATRQDVDAAARAAKTAFDAAAWRDLSASARADLIERAAAGLVRNEAALAAAVKREVGKSDAEALAEVREGFALWRYAAASLRSLHGETYPDLAPAVQGFTFYEPVGVVALILPWNFPFLVAAERLPFILAAGCTVVAKPSEFAAETSFITAKVLAEAGLPAGVYNVITGAGSEAGAALVEARDVAMVSFTGSTENGRRVAEAAGRGLKRVSLELGGKSPVIVFADADLPRAVDAAIVGFTYNAGQCCIATSRLLVERGAADEVKRLLAARLEERATTFTQPPATEPQHARVVDFVTLGAQTGRVIAGGLAGTKPPPGTPIPPTVLDTLPADSKVARDEVFGMVLTVHEFSGEDEAVQIANDTIFGLAGCVWSKDVAKAMRVAKRMRAGRLWINSKQVNFPELPVGGYGASGMGREAGSAGIKTYSECKTLILGLE